jgi:hypothetical protein
MSLEGKKKPSEHTCFILALDPDASAIEASLKALGYGRVVNPFYEDFEDGSRRSAKQRKKVVVRDLRRLFDCTMVVMGPQCERLPWAMALVSTAGTMGMDFERIEVLDPKWRNAA